MEYDHTKELKAFADSDTDTRWPQSQRISLSWRRLLLPPPSLPQMTQFSAVWLLFAIDAPALQDATCVGVVDISSPPPPTQLLAP